MVCSTNQRYTCVESSRADALARDDRFDRQAAHQGAVLIAADEQLHRPLAELAIAPADRRGIASISGSQVTTGRSSLEQACANS